MVGRENSKENDLFFTCSLIEYIARKTMNKREDIVNQLGKFNIGKIYELADIYHSDNIDRVSEDFIRESNISNGDFDNIKTSKYSIPSHWDIGKVYKRLILDISKEKDIEVIEALFMAYNSFVSEKIQDYNSSFYYDAPKNIFNAYLYGVIE